MALVLSAGAFFAMSAAPVPAPAPALHLINQTVHPHARCLDGSAPAYYWRDGRGVRGAKSLVLFLEGGGWCFPSDIQQPSGPSLTHNNSGANCHIRAASDSGSSAAYPPSAPAGHFEGGTGIISGDPTRTAFADFAVAYAKYCDGGSFSGTRTAPDVALNGTGPLWYAGSFHLDARLVLSRLLITHSLLLYLLQLTRYAGSFNLDAVLAELVSAHGVGGYERVVLSGCSAGGMSCYLHCDRVAAALKQAAAPHGGVLDVKCICDAGLFIDVPTVTGAGDVMRARFYDVADKMGARDALGPACVDAEADWRECMFSETSLKYTSTPTFAMNSMYNFGEWEMLPPPSNLSFPPATVTAAADWLECWPSTGGLTADTYAQCNSTQRVIIAAHLADFKAAAAPAAAPADPSSPHGAWLSSCPSMHCQSGYDRSVLVQGLTVGEAAERWYFNGTETRLVDAAFPQNKLCPKANVTGDENE